MNNYEAIYIINPNVEDEPRQKLVERFSSIVTGGGGTLEKVDDWGKRKLAYLIDDLSEGHYILLAFSGNPELPRELERNLKNSEDILRYIVVKKDA